MLSRLVPKKAAAVRAAKLATVNFLRRLDRGKVTELTLHSIDFSVAQTIIPLFPNLDTLSLEYGWIGQEMDEQAPKLKNLRFVALGSQINSEVLLRKLERLDFSFSSSDYMISVFDHDTDMEDVTQISKKFIALVPTLTQLKRLAVHPDTSRGITFPLGSSFSLLSPSPSFPFSL